jgi:lipopolysaccharide/colanic/teichoic acid biosynthesis glycosyltransferase
MDSSGRERRLRGQALSAEARKAAPASAGAATLKAASSHWRLEAAFVVVSLCACFLAAPQFYLWLVTRLGGPLTRATVLHIFANSCANFMVVLASWSARGRLDTKLGRVLSATFASHGLVALAVVLTRTFYSNSVMLAAALTSLAFGVIAVIVQHRLKPPRVGVIAPSAPPVEHLPPAVEHIQDPAEDLLQFDLILTGATEELPLEWTRSVSRAMLAGRPVRHCAEYLEETRGLVSLEHFDVDQLPKGGLTSYQAGKRAFDLVLACVALPIAAPILALSCLLILVSMGRPMFFVQPRVGLGGRSFRMVKLRTMTHGAARPDVEGKMAVAEGQRITRLGAWLRRLRIDELPQLWHVLVGEMSFIGPRPEWTLLAERYAAQLPIYAFRHLVRPGITGWAQVRSGYAGNLDETRLKVAHDLYYLKHLSFGLDLQILLRTIWTLATTRGAR